MATSTTFEPSLTFPAADFGQIRRPGGFLGNFGDRSTKCLSGIRPTTRSAQAASPHLSIYQYPGHLRIVLIGEGGVDFPSSSHHPTLLTIGRWLTPQMLSSMGVHSTQHRVTFIFTIGIQILVCTNSKGSVQKSIRIDDQV